MITDNQIIKPDSIPASFSEKEKMNLIVNRVIALIKEKHL